MSKRLLNLKLPILMSWISATLCELALSRSIRQLRCWFLNSSLICCGQSVKTWNDFSVHAIKQYYMHVPHYASRPSCCCSRTLHCQDWKFSQSSEVV
jgi:hypothetical protein